MGVGGAKRWEVGGRFFSHHMWQATKEGEIVMEGVDLSRRLLETALLRIMQFNQLPGHT